MMGWEQTAHMDFECVGQASEQVLLRAQAKAPQTGDMRSATGWVNMGKDDSRKERGPRVL